jgi:hypothetical protein
MDAEFRPEADDQTTDQAIDPIGPPVLPRISRHTARALALTGVAIGAPLAIGALDFMPTWTCSSKDL